MRNFLHIKFCFIILLTGFLAQGFGQKTSAAMDTTRNDPSIADSSDITKVVIGRDRIIIEDDNEALKVRIGNRGLTILESLESGDPKIRFEKYDNNRENSADEEYIVNDYHDYEDLEKEKAERRSRFKGHWSGIQFGFNNYVTSDYSLVLPENINYMSLHSGKSNNFNINFAQTSLGLARRIGFVTGLGLNWNNYRFDGNNNIIKGENGVIEKLDPEETLKKSKWSTLYLTLPFILEFQIPADHNHLNIAAGPIGAIKLCSKSKMVFENGDNVKSDDDFSLNMLRYGAIAYIGFENFQVYGTYYFMPLFKNGKAPAGIDLYPFEIGIAFTID